MDLRKLRSAARRVWRTLRPVPPREPELHLRAHALIGEQRSGDALALLADLPPVCPANVECYAARGSALSGLGRYEEALADFDACVATDPVLARNLGLHSTRSFMHGLLDRPAAARDAMAAHVFEAVPPGPTDTTLAAFLFDRLRDKLPGRESVGVVVTNSAAAIGHAILDPFHFLQLFRHRFGRLVLVHPPLSTYSPQARVAASVVNRYFDTIECDDPQVLMFAWRHFGEMRHENVTFLVYQYQSLNRMAFRARREPAHPMSRRRDYLRLSDEHVERAEAACRRCGFDTSRPMVVVHTREHGYHKLGVQRFRNTAAENYAPALRHLAACGFLVVRVGDGGMSRLDDAVPGIVELPFLDHYEPLIDSYLISKCHFMISCQSGPCSFARAFGKPTLVVNGVYHHTLLPEHRELIAFKTYRDAAGRAMGVADLLAAGAHRFDVTDQFDAAGITVEDVTPAEILAATVEMLDALDSPPRPDTPAQAAFRSLMMADPDYIGYALPECRVSDTVCRMRPGYV